MIRLDSTECSSGGVFERRAINAVGIFSSTRVGRF